MRRHIVVTAMALVLTATWAIAQTYVATPGGQMEARAAFVWNGTAWVAQPSF